MSKSDSLDFADSFSHYTNAQLGQKWTTAGFAGLDGTHGRGGRTCVQMGTSGVSGALNKTFIFNSSGWTIGFAYQIQGAGNTNNAIIELQGVYGLLLSLNLQPDGSLALFGGSKLIGICNTVMYIGQWYYVEVQGYFVNTATLLANGHINVTGGVHINGVLEIAQTLVNSGITTVAGSAAATTNSVQFNGPNSPFTGCYFQDPYMCDTGGFDELNYLGDLKVIPYFPISDAAGNVWIGSPHVTPNTYLNVNSNPANDSDTITDSTAGDVSSFLSQNISGFSGTVEGVHCVARANGGSGETIAFVLGPPGAGNYFAGRTQGIPLGVFGFVSQGWIENLDPAVNAVWTVGNFNAENFGVEEINP